MAGATSPSTETGPRRRPDEDARLGERAAALYALAVRVREVLRESWALYRRHWRRLAVLVAIFYVAVVVFLLFLLFLTGDLVLLVAPFLLFAAVFWLQGVLSIAVDDIRDGHVDLTVRETLAHIRPRMNRLSLASLGALVGLALAGFLFGFGLALFVLPGLVVLVGVVVLVTRWSLLVPVLVLERRGLRDSLRRSTTLVRGHGAPMFKLLVVAALVLVLLAQISHAVTDWLSILVQLAIMLVVTPFFALALTLAYFRLRALKEPAPTGDAAL